jgi:hydroxyethylthiazole kinase-like uncharacterized protein yjeF
VFGHAHVPLLTPAEAAAQDRRAREAAGVPERVLMESAGRAAALLAARLAPRGRIVAVAGSGSNGGDAAVAVRTLRAWGRDAELVAAGSRLPDPALLHGHDVPVHEAAALTARLAGAALVLDGLLGTGLTGPARGSAAAAIEAINAAGRPILALDLPSGVAGETGGVAGPAVRATTTVCFGWPKLGLLFQPARTYCGRLMAVEIGFPPLAAAAAELATPAWATTRLPTRAPDAHKGAVGRLLIVAGSSGMAGAAALAGLAARMMGAGLVRLASPEPNRAILQTLVPEATFLDRGLLAVEPLDWVHAVVVGPGMGTDADAAQALEAALLRTAPSPVLLDADALTLLAARPDALRALAAGRPVVLTPHAGELERLVGRPAVELAADPVAAARAAADRFGCVVLLKGQPSVVAAPGRPLLVNTTGSSDTAAAGMGDQLAGTIGALLAAGLDARDAAGAGLFLAGRAADLAGLGRSLGPRDVARWLPAALVRPGAAGPPGGLGFVTFDQPQRW